MGADGSKAGNQEGQAEGAACSGVAPPPTAEAETNQDVVPDKPAKTDKPEEERLAAAEQPAAEKKTAAAKPVAEDKAADKTAADKPTVVDEHPAEAPALDKPCVAQAAAAAEQRTVDKPVAVEKPAAAEAPQAPPRGARATDSATAPEAPAVTPEAASLAEAPPPRTAVVRGTPAPKAPVGPAPAPKAPEPRSGASAPQAPAGPAPAAKGAPAAAGKATGAADGGKGPKGQTKGKGSEAGSAPPAGKKGKGGESAGVQLSVRNLSQDVTTETLRRLFSAYGTVTHALVKMTPEGQCRGFGFVKFATADEADAAIKGTHLQAVDGKLLHVELSVSRAQTPSEGQWPAGKGTAGDFKGAKGKGKISELEPTDVLKRLLAVGSHEGGAGAKGGGKPADHGAAYWKGGPPAKGGKVPGDWAKGGDWPKGDRAKGGWAKGEWAKGDWFKGDWAKGDWSKGDWAKGDWSKGKSEWAKGASQKGASQKGTGKGHATEITNRMLSEWKTVGGQILQEQAGAPPGDHSRPAPERPYYGGGGEYGSPWAAGGYGWRHDGEPTTISLDGYPSAAQSRAAHESRLAHLNSSAARLQHQANLAQQQALSSGYGQGLAGGYPAAGTVGTLAQAAAAVAAARLRQAFERQGYLGYDAYDVDAARPPDQVFVDALPVPSAAALAAAERELVAEAAKERASAGAASPPRPGNAEYSGHLKSVSSKNGFGFISCKETHEIYKRDVYVDQAQLPEGTKLLDKLQFTVKLSDKGHPRAVRVVKLD